MEPEDDSTRSPRPHPSPAAGSKDGSGRMLWGGYLGRAEEEEAGARALVHRGGDALAVWEGRGALGGGRARTQSTLKPTDGVMGGYGDPGGQHRDPSRPSPTARWGGTTPAATSSDASTRCPTTTVSAAARRCGRETWVKKYSRKNWGKDHTMK